MRALIEDEETRIAVSNLNLDVWSNEGVIKIGYNGILHIIISSTSSSFVIICYYMILSLLYSKQTYFNYNRAI